MKLKRLEGWQDKFFAYLEATRATPFEWGQHDCCLFAAKSIDAICGSPLELQLKIDYRDEASALAYIAQFGSLEAAVSNWLGESKAPNFAGPGDIVLANLDNGPTVGVCLGVKCAFASVAGPLYTQRDAIVACWVI
jgi:hypothetical protein